MRIFKLFQSLNKGIKTGFLLSIILLFESKSITAQSACDLYFDFITQPTSCYASDGSFTAYASDLPGNPCKRKIEVYKGASLIASGFEEITVSNLPTGSYEVIAYNDCGCSQVQSKIVEISGGNPTLLKGHMDIGNGYLKLEKASVCKDSDIKIGTQSLGLNGFTISGPNGFLSSVPDGNTFWVFENLKPVQSGIYRIAYQNNQGCNSQVEFSLTIKDLKVNAGSDFSLCKEESKNIIPQVSGQSICRGSCNTDSSKVLVSWNLNNCNAIGFSNQNDYREFTPTYPNHGNCLEIIGSNVYRDQGGHSCTPSIEQVGMCIPALQQCDPAFYNPVNAIKFSVNVTPEKTSRLTKLTFYEQSPLEWQTTDGNSGINNYNTKFLVKIYKNGNLIYNNVNFETKRTWNLVEIDLSVLPEFTSHEAAFYEFELMGYCVVNQGGILSGWEIDDIRIIGTCCTNAPIFDNISYLWSNGSINAFIKVTPTESSSYSVTVTDCDGCKAVDSVFVTSLEKPDVEVQISANQICSGGNAILTATGGATYMWSTGQTTSSISVNPIITTTYSVTVTDTNGCTNNAVKTLTVFPLPNVSISGPDAICTGGNAIFDASGGVTYLWNTGQTTASINVNPNITTTYSVTVTDSNGCTNSANKALNVLPIPNVSITGPEAMCSGGNATFTASGGGSYFWNTGQTTASINVNPNITTTYSVTVTDINGCTNNASKTLTLYPLPNVSIAGPEAICSGGNATFTASGGGSYFWNTGQTTASINVNANITTTYSVTVTDINGCTNNASKTLTLYPLPNVSIAGPEAICTGGNATFTASGGGSYIWNTGQTSASITVNPTLTTSYSVIVTDANGCTNSANKTLDVFPLPNVSIIGPDAICRGGNATLTASGGGSYLWNTGQITASISVNPMFTSTYSVTVTDINGCTATVFKTLNILPVPIASIAGPEAICTGGVATLTASGGGSFLWNTGQTTAAINVNPTSTTTYSVTVTDANGCTNSANKTLSILPLPDITISGKDTICVGECTTLTASGGVTYQWNVPSNADCDGGYFIGGQQNNGPQSLYRFTAAGALQLIGATNTTRLNGNGFYCQNNNPRLFGMVRKGDAVTTAIRADFAITDARSGNTQVLGEIPLPPNPYGLGGVSGILNFIGEVTPQGNFLFPAISALINPFTFQIEQYTVYIGQIDVNNHGNGANVTYVPLTIDPSCDPYMEACVEAFRTYALNPAGREPSGGIQDWTLSPDGNSLYAFLGIENGLLRIDLPSRTAFCTPGPASNLTFTGTVGAQTDEFGGMYFDNNRLIGWQVDRGRLFEINTSTGALSLISSSLPLDYRGDNATCTPCGSNDSDEPSITVCPEETTSYTVIVTDANGCSNSKSVTVVVKQNINVSISGDNQICVGESSVLTASGGSSYIWSTGQTSPFITVNPSSTTSYSVTVTNADACNGSDDFTLTVLPLPDITISGKDTICVGECTTLTASGGVTYQWNVPSNADCDGGYFIGGQQNNGPQSLYRFTAAGALQLIGATNTTRLNGNGFYCQNNDPKLFGMVRKGDAVTTAIRADFAITDARSGNTQVLGEIPLPPNPYGLGGVSGILNFIGEVTPQGNFLFPAISALINPFTFQIEQYTVYIGQIDVNNHGNGANVTYVPLTIDPSCDPYMEACVEAFRAYALNPAGREPSGGIQDWTLSPDGNSLFAFLGIENGLLRIDLPSRTAFCTPGPASNLTFTGTVGAQTDEFGGMYFDNNRLIGWQVDRGRLFEINTSTGALSLISSSLPLDYRGDNATCTPCGSNDSDEPSITVCPEQTTSYTVIVTDANGCSNSKSVTVVVKQNINVSISGDNQICVGESSVLTASGGSSYIWSTGQTTPSITVNPSSTTTYSVTVTNADACNGSDDFTLTVLPLPDITISGKDTICVGECTTLTASGGVTYQWNVPSNADCDGGYFIGGQQNNGPQSLYRFTAAGALQLIGATNTTRLNGNGFYCHNNDPKLFGMVRKGDAVTTAIRADFAITDARSGNTQSSVRFRFLLILTASEVFPVFLTSSVR